MNSRGGPRVHSGAIVLCVASAALLGCLPHTQHTATPVENVTFSIVGGISDSGPPKTNTALWASDPPSSVPSFEVNARFPLASFMDIGVGLAAIRTKFDLNVALLNTEVFALSLAPAAAAGLVPILRDSHWLAELPLLLDVVKTDGFILTLGGKAGYADGAYYGGSLGMLFRTSKRGALMPSIDVINYLETGDNERRYYVSLGFGVHL